MTIGKWKVLVLLVITVFLAMLVWQVYANSSISISKKDYTHPVFLDGYGIIGNDKEWKVSNIQPVVVGYYSKNGRSYMLVKYPRQKGGQKTGAVLISGEVAGVGKLEKVVFEDEVKEISILSFEELKDKLELKKQVKLSYLAEIPADFGDNDFVCNMVDYICKLCEIKIKTEDLLKNDFGIFVRPEKIYIPTMISLDLEQNEI